MPVDLLALLNQSAASLGAHRAYGATAGHNLENANTPGYARQRAELSALLPSERVSGGYVGRGVTLTTITQARDRFLESQLPRTFADAASSSAEASALQSLTALDPGGTLTRAFGSFFSALRDLSQNPGNSALREVAVSEALTLGRAFNQTATAIKSARDGVDAQLSAVVTEANTLSGQLAQLNQQIRVARASGGSPNDLLDARQKAQDRLSELTGAVPVPNAQGDVNMVLASGAALVSADRSAVLSTIPDASNGGHLALQLAAADGSSAAKLGGGIGGNAGGLLAARDGGLGKAQAAVDQLAFDFGNAVNSTHRVGFGLDAGTNRDLFDVGALSGAASRIGLNSEIGQDPRKLATASSAAALPGDASNLLATIATEQQALSFGLNASDALGRLISDFGSSATRASATSDHDAAVLANLRGMRESVSGVSIDEEMINMTKAQRAFEAVTKVIQTADSMLDTLMKLK